MKILMSAYACEPFKGSEPEVGWQWALQMARFHDVTVLTRSNNRENIERGLAALPPGTPVPCFIYFDTPGVFWWLKSRLRMPQLYYIIWQKSAWHVISELNKSARFDLLHHITFAGYRYTTAIWNHGVPCIWGPVGGMEAMPSHLLPGQHFSTMIFEILRNANNALQSLPFHVIPERAAESTLTLVSTRETADVFKALGAETQTFPTIGISREAVSDRTLTPPTGPLKLLFVGSIISLKGVELAILGLQAARSDATLTFVGDGKYLDAAKALVRKLNLTDRVHFLGRKPREEVLKIYSSYHVFLFPSLHDSGAFVVIEAMAQGLPVICLDCGGPAISVVEGCGIRVPLGRRKDVVKGIAEGIEYYDNDREKVARHGEAARKTVLLNYDWDRKGEKMNAFYNEALQRGRKPDEAWKDPLVIQKITQRAHLFSRSGIIAVLLSFALVMLVQVWTMRELRNQAEAITKDTLPGLVHAGAANETRNRSFISTLLLITHINPENDEAYAREMNTFSAATAEHLKVYQESIYEIEDAANFRKLLSARAEYLKVREKVQQLLEQGDKNGAFRLLSEQLVPAYINYDHMGQKLMDFNISQGRNRSASIMRMYRITEITLALEAVAIFAIGFGIGFFKK